MFIETSPSVYFNLNSAIKISFIHCLFDENTHVPDYEIYSQVVVYTPLIKDGKRVVYNYYSNRDEAIYLAIQDYVRENSVELQEIKEAEEETVEGN